ncbi:hypothetical protein AURDEDRAFT_127323 [Auricularia subglabra TFB-10046 SS5]|nr:hypothetical protein AURDEDRAFT_127323 [Auricularia subglabra TFB-10046 SS5]
MVFTRGQLRRGSHTSDEDIATSAGSHPAGSSRQERKQRIKKPKETIASLSPAKPGRRIFELLDEDPPERRGSWEGPDTSAKPASIGEFEAWNAPSFRAIEDTPGEGADQDSQALVHVDRPVSRAGSSVPSLVTVSDSSDDEVETARKTHLPESSLSSGPRSPENSPAPSPGPSRPVSPTTDDVEMSRMLEMFCADILETLDDEGQEAALTYLGDVFPQNDLAINREWLRYLLECRENGDSWDPATLDSFSLNEWPRSRAIPVWGPGLKSYRDAVTSVHSSSIGLSPPGPTGKGKAVDRERPAATSTPKSSRTFEHFEFDFQAPAQPETKQPSVGDRKPRKSGSGGTSRIGAQSRWTQSQSQGSPSGGILLRSRWTARCRRRRGWERIKTFCIRNGVE